MSVLSGADGKEVVTAPADPAQEALDGARSYREQVLALSDDARRELVLVVDRQWRLNGMPTAWSLGRDAAQDDEKAFVSCYLDLGAGRPPAGRILRAV